MYWKTVFVAAAALSALAASGSIAAQEPAQEVAELREMIEAMKSDYEARINRLEKRLEEAEEAVADAADRAEEAEETADEAEDQAEEVAMRPVQRTSSPSDQNPAISAIVLANYQSLDVGGEGYTVPGFMLGPETSPGESGFSLDETEINFNANIDDKFYGDVTFALHDHEGATEVELEEAYIQTLAMPAGLQLKAGRFWSDIGYLNVFHPHADEFVDRPLPYKAFLGKKFADDGLQVSWLAPTSTFLRLGAEVFQGDAFPGGAAPDEKPGAWSLFAETGGDFGVEHSWKAGLSYLHAEVDEGAGGGHDHEEVFFKQEDHEEEDEHDEELFFAGDRDLWIADFVYKWAPNGNPRNRNVKIQGEFFLRDEEGEFGEHVYSGEQTGWYLQGSYQFDPQWRVGYRYDQLDADNDGEAVAGSVLDPLGLNPERHSLVLEWFNSEFSRVRFQYSRDEATLVSDNQFFLQYIVSIGAHGAHEF